MDGHRFFAAGAVSWLLLAAAVAGFAEGEEPFREISLSGRFARGHVGQFAMLSGERPWLVMLDSREPKQPTRLQFKATGHASILRPKMYVRLTASVDPAAGKATEPIRRITWFTPLHETRYGMFPADVHSPLQHRHEGELRERELRERELRERELRERELRERELRERELLERERHRDFAADGPPREYRIVGWIEKLRGGEIVIEFDGGRIEAELAEDVEVDVDIDNKQLVYSMIKPGDRLEVAGRYREAGRVCAREVVVHREGVMGQPLARAKPAPRGAADSPAVPPSASGGDEAEIAPGGSFGSAEPLPPAAERPRLRILKIN